MKKYINEGKIDRIVRLVLAFVFLIAASYFSGTLKVVLIVFGVISLVTSVTGFCGIYKVFGIRTLPKEKIEEVKPIDSNLNQ